MSSLGDCNGCGRVFSRSISVAIPALTVNSSNQRDTFGTCGGLKYAGYEGILQMAGRGDAQIGDSSFATNNQCDPPSPPCGGGSPSCQTWIVGGKGALEIYDQLTSGIVFANNVDRVEFRSFNGDGSPCDTKTYGPFRVQRLGYALVPDSLPQQFITCDGDVINYGWSDELENVPTRNGCADVTHARTAQRVFETGMYERLIGQLAKYDLNQLEWGQHQVDTWQAGASAQWNSRLIDHTANPYTTPPFTAGYGSIFGAGCGYPVFAYTNYNCNWWLTKTQLMVQGYSVCLIKKTRLTCGLPINGMQDPNPEFLVAVIQKLQPCSGSQIITFDPPENVFEENTYCLQDCTSCTSGKQCGDDCYL